jgi:hypothetical protein
MRALETTQQNLALVLGEYRITSNRDEHGFTTVTSAFFFFSPGYGAIQNPKPGLQGGGIKAPSQAWSVYLCIVSLKVDLAVF